MWSETYRPKRLEEMVGNDEVRAKLVAWLTKWKRGIKALLLVGPPGIGKTTTVILASRRLGLNLVQLNASDRRTKGMLSERLGEALLSTNLFGEKTLIFLDEVDGLAGRADFGAVDFIKDSVRKSQNPIVMAANDPESDEVRKLASVCTTLLFVKPSDEQLVHYLQVIARKEGAEVTDEFLKKVATYAHGDIRSAINSLQGGAPAIKDEELTASQSINSFLSATDLREAVAGLRAFPGQPRDKIRVLFSSVLHSRINQERRAAALEVLSRVDLLLGQMIKGGDWRLLRYLDSLLASDFLSALGDGGVRYSLESNPWPLQARIWNDSRKLKDLGSWTGKRMGIGMKGALVEDIPYIMLLCGDSDFRDNLVRALNLEENYALFVTKEAARMARLS